LPAGLTYVEVSAGVDHGAALRSDGEIVAWGDNEDGQCEVPEPPRDTTWREVDAGGNMTVGRYGPAAPEPQIYCTAKSNSLGCTPSIAMVGIPSASFGNGCTLTVASVIGNKNGLLFHSTSGAAALPFHGGVLCLRAPLRRHAGRNSEGTAGTCDGVLSEDLNIYIASGADPALVAGATLWIQAWSRDPGDSFGDSLSDAITAIVSP
jgi:hypothetical protein